MPIRQYTDLTIEQIFFGLPSKMYGTSDRAIQCWSEAVNIFEVRQTIIEWFNALQEGTANDRYPDPFIVEAPKGKLITQERADDFVEQLEADMLLEKARFGSLNRDAGPGFTRLESHAKIAFMQSIWSIMKTPQELMEDADRRFRERDLPESILKVLDGDIA